MSEWYYSTGGQQEGPVSQQELQQKARAGEVSGQDLVWTEGMQNWTPYAQVQALANSEVPVGAPVQESLPSAAVPASPAVSAPVSPAPAPATPAPNPYDQMVQPQPGMPLPHAMAPTCGVAIASLVCGLLGLFGFLCLSFVAVMFSLPAVIFGHLSLKRMKDPHMPLQGKGMALTGLVTGYLGLLINLALIGLVVIAISSEASSMP